MFDIPEPYSPHPQPRRKKAEPYTPPSQAEQQRACEALAKIQAGRPLRPPGVRRL